MLGRIFLASYPCFSQDFLFADAVALLDSLQQPMERLRDYDLIALHRGPFDERIAQSARPLSVMSLGLDLSFGRLFGCGRFVRGERNDISHNSRFLSSARAPPARYSAPVTP